MKRQRVLVGSEVWRFGGGWRSCDTGQAADSEKQTELITEKLQQFYRSKTVHETNLGAGR